MRIDRNLLLVSRIMLCCIAWFSLAPQVSQAREILETDCADQVTCRKDDMSRTMRCLSFNEVQHKCIVKGMVGGEHISTLRIQAGEGDAFLIRFIAETGRPIYWIDGEDASLDLVNSKIWVKTNKDGFFDVLFSAHPYGEFKLIVQKCTDDMIYDTKTTSYIKVDP